jgi:hypothetical protein
MAEIVVLQGANINKGDILFRRKEIKQNNKKKQKM